MANLSQILEGMYKRSVGLKDTLEKRTEECRQFMLALGRGLSRWSEDVGVTLDQTSYELSFAGEDFKFIHHPYLNLEDHYIEIVQRIKDIHAAHPQWRSVGMVQFCDGKVFDHAGSQQNPTDEQAAMYIVWLRILNAVDNPNGNLP